MNISALPTAKFTITVLNKLGGQDNVSRQDAWYKTVIKDCTEAANAVRSVSGNTGSIGGTRVVRVPKQANYAQYASWASSPQSFVTFSLGDYVIFGEISETTITPQNIMTIVQKYRPNAFEIRYFRDNTQFGLMNHYHLEGV